MRHKVQAEGRSIFDRQVDVAGESFGRVAASAYCAREEAIDGRRFAHQIDRAARRAAPGEGRARPFGYFDLFQIERIARLRTEVASAVNEDVVARAESTQRQVVASRSPAFARGHSQAGDVAKHVA